MAAIFLFGCAIAALTARAAGAAEFERTVPVVPGTRLDVRLYGGEVVVRAWDRDAVRIRATHFATDAIDVRNADGVVTVRARAEVGRPHAIDLTIDIPSAMPLAIAGTYVEISVTGSRASVSADTVRGDVRVHGGRGRIALKSLEGEVVLEGAEGSASLTAVNNSLRVTGLVGDLVASTVNGSVELERIDSTSVEVGTVGGDISWTGPVAGAGHYRFATHAGDIDITLAGPADAAVSVRPLDGQFRTTYPITVPAGTARSKRFTLVLGSGAARIDLETFRGTISLRPGQVTPKPKTPAE
jgi:DUF4097 and DUF4098 domain-containing protein YvlB